ncbi:MAG: hypothetical protein ABI980_09825 [Nitrospirota bacterium]
MSAKRQNIVRLGSGNTYQYYLGLVEYRLDKSIPPLTAFRLVRPIIQFNGQANAQVLRIDQNEIHSLAINLIGK